MSYARDRLVGDERVGHQRPGSSLHWRGTISPRFGPASSWRITSLPRALDQVVGVEDRPPVERAEEEPPELLPPSARRTGRRLRAPASVQVPRVPAACSRRRLRVREPPRPAAAAPPGRVSIGEGVAAGDDPHRMLGEDLRQRHAPAGTPPPGRRRAARRGRPARAARSPSRGWSRRPAPPASGASRPGSPRGRPAAPASRSPGFLTRSATATPCRTPSKTLASAPAVRRPLPLLAVAVEVQEVDLVEGLAGATAAGPGRWGCRDSRGW